MRVVVCVLTWIVAPAWAGSIEALCSSSGSRAPSTIETATMAASEAAMASASYRGYLQRGRLSYSPPRSGASALTHSRAHTQRAAPSRTRSR